VRRTLVAATVIAVAGCAAGSPPSASHGLAPVSSTPGIPAGPTRPAPPTGTGPTGTGPTGTGPTGTVPTSSVPTGSARPSAPGIDAVGTERQFWQAVTGAEAASNGDLPALVAIADAEALAAVRSAIAAYSGKGQVLRGPITPTAPKLAGADQGGLIVKDCIDASGNLAYERATGALVAGQPASNRFVATFLVRRTATGVKVVNDGFGAINSC